VAPSGPCPFAVERLYAAAEQTLRGGPLLSVPRDSDRVFGPFLLFCYFCASYIGAIPRPVALVAQCSERRQMSHFLRKAWLDEEGQDIAEYSVMLAVILVIALGTVRLIGSNANNVFSQVGSAIQ
jgi:Flp pilus assembly pilin Flp